MKSKWFIVILLLIAFGNSACKTWRGTTKPYGLEIVSSYCAYLEQVKADPEKELMDLEQVITGIVLDIRYATEHNFTGQVVYPSAKAYLRKPAALALAAAEDEFRSLGYGLKVYDAYRPYSVTLKFYEVYPDTNFVAAPWKGSVHNTACAVDVTLIHAATAKEVEMPTLFDDFTAQAAADYPNASDEAIRNRELLISIMAKHGFSVLPTEWWHYNFKGYEAFELMDIGYNFLERKAQ